MKIQEYLQQSNISQTAFCRGLKKETGADLSQGGLSKYVIGMRTPRKEVMVAIHQYTGGKVSPNDFCLDESTP